MCTLNIHFPYLTMYLGSAFSMYKCLFFPVLQGPCCLNINGLAVHVSSPLPSMPRWPLFHKSLHILCTNAPASHVSVSLLHPGECPTLPGISVSITTCHCLWFLTTYQCHIFPSANANPPLYIISRVPTRRTFPR